MRRAFFCCVCLFCALLCARAQAAQDNSYDKFYKADESFRKADERLNSAYRNLQSALPWGARNSLLAEQRFWHDRLFPLLADEATGADAQAAARKILERRIENLEKLSNSAKASDILGLKISFGMSESETAARLGLKSVSDLRDEAFKIRLFGQDAPIRFSFMRTGFVAEGDAEKNAFAKFAAAVAEAFCAREYEIAQSDGKLSFTQTALVGVGAGGFESRDDFQALNESLAKKYKEAWPASRPLRILLAEKFDMLRGMEAEDFASRSDEKIYEDRERYIFVAGSWGTLTGEFSVDYLCRPWLDLHLYNLDALLDALSATARYGASLGILPSGAGLEDVVYAIGDREVSFFQLAGGFYDLGAQFRGAKDSEASLDVFMTPQNEAFGIKFSFVEDELVPGFEEKLKKSLAKRYKTLKETPEAVAALLGHSSNMDADFETEGAYIHFGATPHYAVQHEFSVIDKKRLAEFMEAYKAGAEKARQAEKDRKEEVNRDLEKF